MAKTGKYRNIPTVVDGIRFDSKKEARRYCELKLLCKAGQIHTLALQPSFALHIKGKKIFTYKADFSYVENGLKVVEDVKSAITRKNAVYRIKKKAIEAQFGFEIREV